MMNDIFGGDENDHQRNQFVYIGAPEFETMLEELSVPKPDRIQASLRDAAALVARSRR